jgi:hypothetical protein
MRIAACLLLLVSAARADEVTLKNGAKFTGIAREEGDKVVLEMAIGTVTIPKDDVASVTYARTELHEFHDKLKACATVDDALALARAQKLSRLRALASEKAVAFDAENAEARKALGHEKVEGRWTSRQEREDRERAKQDEERAKERLARAAAERRHREELEAVEREYRARLEDLRRSYEPERRVVVDSPWGYSFFRRRVATGAAAGVPLWTPLWYPEYCPLLEDDCCVRPARQAPAAGVSAPGFGFNNSYYQDLYRYYGGQR